MESKINVTPEEFQKLPDDEKANFFVQTISSDTILVNLSMWLDLAIAKGRFIDHKIRANAVSESYNDKEQEVPENE